MDVVDRVLWPVALAGIAWMAAPSASPPSQRLDFPKPSEITLDAPPACLHAYASLEPAPVSRHRTDTRLHRTSDGADLPESVEGRYPMKLYCSYRCWDPLRDAVDFGRWDLIDRYAAWFARTGPQTRSTCDAITAHIDAGRAKVRAMARVLVAANSCTAVEALRAELAIAWPTGHAAIAGIACSANE